MLLRRNRREKDAQQEKTLTQDGFSAAVEEERAYAVPRPWHEAEETDVIPAVLSAVQQPMYPMPDRAIATAAAMQEAQPAPRGACRMPTGYAQVGRCALDFADNGDGTLTAVRCINPDADDLDIQFEAGACPVTAIAPRAFEGCTALRRVVLPESLRQIGEMAFSGCIHLTQMVIPGSVQRVGTLAFAKCTGLTHVRIEPGVQALGPSCFSKCTSLARVDAPASLTTFGGGVFFGCGRQLCLYGAEDSPAQQYARLNGLSFDAEGWREDDVLVLKEQEDGTLLVTGLREDAPERIDIPAEICGRRIVGIASRAFFLCDRMTQVAIGANVREIADNAFFGCRGLTSVHFERGLEHVCDGAFMGCEALAQVTLPWGTVSVGRMAFYGCKRLSFVKMPATTRVSDRAFEGCSPTLRIFGGVQAGFMQGMEQL